MTSVITGKITLYTFSVPKNVDYKILRWEG